MKVTILGSGTCVPCAHRNSSGYFVEINNTNIRLDAGAGTLHAMDRYNLPWESVTHQFVSHFHLDHVNELAAYLFSLKYGCSTQRHLPLSLIGPVGLKKLLTSLSSLYQQRFLEQEFPIHFHELAPKSSLDLSPKIKLSVEKTPHNKESLAIRLDTEEGSLGYTGDTAPSRRLEEFFSGVDLLIAECSFLEDTKNTAHLNADMLSNLASRAKVKHLLATHFYFDPEKEGLRKKLSSRFSGKITLATDGLSLEVLP